MEISFVLENFLERFGKNKFFLERFLERIRKRSRTIRNRSRTFSRTNRNRSRKRSRTIFANRSIEQLFPRNCSRTSRNIVLEQICSRTIDFCCLNTPRIQRRGRARVSAGASRPVDLARASGPIAIDARVGVDKDAWLTALRLYGTCSRKIIILTLMNPVVYLEPRLFESGAGAIANF